MSDAERQLTDPNFIADELSGILARGDELALSLMEKYSHGESFGIEEDVAKAIMDKLSKVHNNDPEKQLMESALAHDYLVHAIPLLIAGNNKRLLELLGLIPPVSP